MKRHLYLFATLLVFAACSKGPTNGEVELVNRNFSEEAPIQGNLVFTFNQPMVSDTLLGKWEEEKYLTFSPDIPGRYSWRAVDELVFSPFELLNPATDYQLSLTNTLTKHNKSLKLVGEKSFSFHTPDLQLQSTNVYWAPLPQGRDAYAVHLDLSFNYPVEASEVAKQVEVIADGKKQKVEPSKSESGTMVRLMLPDLPKADKAIELAVNLKEGLTVMGGNRPSKSQEESMSLASPFVLTIGDVLAQHDGAQGTLTVATSQEVKAQDIKRFISFSPPVKFEVESNSQNLVIRSSDFNVRQKYAINIKKNLRGVLGGSLKKTFAQDVSFGELRPSLKFTDRKSVYLTSAGNRNLEVEIVNVSKVDVKLIKIYENNILNFLDGGGGYYYDDYYEDDYYYDEYSYNGGNYNYYRADQLGDAIHEEEINTANLPLRGNKRVLKLDFEDRLKDYPGMYVMRISATKPHYMNAAKVVCISDIGLITKVGKKQLTIFANSIKTAQPLSGVKLKLIGKNNQEVSQLTTDGNGVATFTMPADFKDGFNVSMITATNGNDFTYLPFSQTRVGTSRFEIGGSRANSAEMEAFLYGERDIYRPGETLHMAGIVRNREWGVPANIPVVYKLIAPNGQAVSTIRKQLDRNGAYTADISLPVSAMTGRYTGQLWTTNDVLLNSQNISIEEFVPDRIKVKVDVDRKEAKAGQNIAVSAQAQNFFGPPAANRNYEVEMTLRRQGFYAKKYAGYNFHIHGLNNNFSKVMRTGKTDAEGKLNESFEISSQYANTGKMAADFFVTVFDETGRPVNRRIGSTIYTQDVFFGLRQEQYYVRTGNKARINVIAVDKEGKALNGQKARIRFIKHEYKTVLARSGSYFRYRSEKQEIVLEDKVVTLNGENYAFEYTPELTGRYELRVSSERSNQYVRNSFWSYGYGSSSYSSFQVNNEGKIDIELDKESYKVGEKANVLLKTPFAGKVLVTLESDQVQKHFYVDTDKRSASFSLDLTSEEVPNIYVSATLIKPHDVSDIPLTVAHGFAPIMVENPSTVLPVSITAPEESRSRKKQTISIKTSPSTPVSIAVVDEGILQLTGYKTPDPHKFFYRKRALEVESYNVYPYLFPEIAMGSGRPGGGDGADMAKRVNPLVNNRVKLASFWSGMLMSDGSGNVTFDIDVPQFSGSLRVMAVAYKNDGFASSETNIRVADPVVISAGLPRVFSPGDTVTVPVTISNTTQSNTSVSADVSVEGPIRILGSQSQKASINANSEKQMTYTVAVDRMIGQAKVAVKVDANGESFLNETEITVRPASPLQQRTGAGQVAGGKSATVNMEMDDFFAPSVDAKLVVSRSPLAQYTKDLSYLIRYPYGCVEQTTSAAFPQLYYNDLARAIHKQNGDNPNPNHHIKKAIQRLQLMQLSNGGLTYWPQRGREHWWGSVYAAHFLTEAKRLGYDVPQSMLDKLYRRLENRLKDVQPRWYYFNGSQKRQISPREVPYSLYVLALAGKPQRSTMNYYKAHLDKLSLDGRYLLAASYALSGDKNRYKDLVPVRFDGEKAEPMLDGSFASYARDEAIALYSLLEIDPNNSQVGVMAKHVQDRLLRGRRYWNTQERAFSFLALGKIAQQAAKSTATATVKFDGKVIGNYDGGDALTLTTDQPGSKRFTIETKGEGNLFYFWETEGISRSGSYKEEDSYIMVRKEFYTRDGGLITNNQVRQNDLVVVRISLKSLTNSNVANVAISDILPAGFEIENPRLTQLPASLNWIKNRSYPEYLDVRDDRLNMFVAANGSTRYYYYLVRAVSAGNFQMGPVGAEAMYSAEYHSYNGGGVMKVLSN
ncbi:MAG: MG2 domain-containing protein [Bacteroidota bacterium]